LKTTNLNFVVIQIEIGQTSLLNESEVETEKRKEKENTTTCRATNES
jgi:hypothetical protein